MSDQPQGDTSIGGRVASLTLVDLRSVLDVTPATPGQMQVSIDGRRADLLGLVERALEVPSGSVSVGQAQRLARGLSLAVAPGPRARPAVTAPYELRSQLARLSRRWVAIADDRVIADAETLSALLEKTRGMPATLLFVPGRTTDEAS